MSHLELEACVGGSLDDAWVLVRRFENAQTTYGWRPDPDRSDWWVVKVVDGAVVDQWASRVELWGFTAGPDGGAFTLAARSVSSGRLAEEDALLALSYSDRLELAPQPVGGVAVRGIGRLTDGTTVLWTGGPTGRVLRLDSQVETLPPTPLTSISALHGRDASELLAISDQGDVSWFRGGQWTSPEPQASLAWPVLASVSSSSVARVVTHKGAWQLEAGKWAAITVGEGTIIAAAAHEDEVWTVREDGVLRRVAPDLGPEQPTSELAVFLHAYGGGRLVTTVDAVHEVTDAGVTRTLTLDAIRGVIDAQRPLWQTRALETDRSRLTAAYPYRGDVYEPVRYGVSHLVGDSFADAHFAGRRTKDLHRPEADEGESFVGRIVDGLIESVVTVPEWVWDLQRSPSGRVYVAVFSNARGGVWRTPTDGSLQWEHLRVPAKQGLFVLHDECALAWCGEELHLFDGAAFRAIPAPEERILGVHGCAPDWIVAVGHHGLITRWDGHAWHRWAVPIDGALSRVHVVSEDEMYATGPYGVLLEGSRHGWAERAPIEVAGNGVAAWRGDVLVADPVQGLLRLVKDSLELVELPAYPANLHPGADALLLTEKDAMVETRDLETFHRLDSYDLATALRDIPPGWR